MKKIFFCLILLAAVLFGCAEKNEIVRPTAPFTPPEFDAGAVAGFPEPDDESFASFVIEEGYEVYLCGNLTAIDGKVRLYFTSPESNTVWLRLLMYNGKGEIIGETGVIKPGEYVEQLTLSAEVKKSTAITMKVVAYEPEEWYSRGTVELNAELTV